MARLNEGDFVYTDKGIEQVHWCEVNGKKELVSPKGYILGDVPSFDEYFRLIHENICMALNEKSFTKENMLLSISIAELRDQIDSFKKDLKND